MKNNFSFASKMLRFWSDLNLFKIGLILILFNNKLNIGEQFCFDNVVVLKESKNCSHENNTL